MAKQIISKRSQLSGVRSGEFFDENAEKRAFEKTRAKDRPKKRC